MSAKVAFLGLGVMGFPMAGHLKAKGYDVTVYNRTAAKAAGLGAEARRPAGRHAGGGRARRRFRVPCASATTTTCAEVASAAARSRA